MMMYSKERYTDKHPKIYVPLHCTCIEQAYIYDLADPEPMLRST